MKDPAKIKKPFMGLDPGKSGGIAIVSHSGKYAEAWPMPETMNEIIYLIKSLLSQVEYAIVERVWSFTGQGVKSMWVFSGNYHTLLAVLRTLEIPMEEVIPVSWKKKIGGLILGKAAEKKQKKATAREKAQSMFRSEGLICHNKKNVIDDKIADALLIAEYCRRLRKGL